MAATPRSRRASGQVRCEPDESGTVQPLPAFQGTSWRAPVTQDDPFMPALAFFAVIAAASFAAGWFGQALLGVF